jgi:hypothetical protein
MSEKRVAERPTTDIIDKDREKLDAFLAEGAPGIGEVAQEQVVKMLDLYIHGRTYDSISGVMRIPKNAVLYFSHKLRWFDIRQEYFTNMQIHMSQRVTETELLSQDFLINLIQMWHKKIGSKMNKYIASDNEEFSNQINLKEFAQYLKAVEMLRKSTALPQESKSLIGINVGSGATVKRTGENEIEITPTTPIEIAKKDMLKYYADLEREKDKK